MAEVELPPFRFELSTIHQRYCSVTSRHKISKSYSQQNNKDGNFDSVIGELLLCFDDVEFSISLDELMPFMDPPYRQIWGQEKKGDRSARKRCRPPPGHGSNNDNQDADDDDAGEFKKKSRKEEDGDGGQQQNGDNGDGDEDNGNDKDKHDQGGDNGNDGSAAQLGSQDDTAVGRCFNRNVGYLEYKWTENELHASWRILSVSEIDLLSAITTRKCMLAILAYF